MGSFIMIEHIFQAKSGKLFIIDMLNNLIQIYDSNTLTTSVFNQQNTIKPLSVYPNPSMGSFKVECSQPIISSRVINLLGKSETFYSNDIQTNSKGLLIVESKGAEGSIYRSMSIVD